MIKRGIIALLSVLALAFVFAGCGDSGSFTEVKSDVDNTPVEVVVADDDTAVVNDTVAEYLNGLSISDELGVPPVRP